MGRALAAGDGAARRGGGRLGGVVYNPRMKAFPNNFDFLRLFAALCVLASHQYALLGLPEPAPLPAESLGSLGVAIFFSISGYLVTQSWVSDPHIFRFAAKRFLRIWPGLTVATCVFALVLGPLATELPLRAYFSSPGFQAFFYTLRLRIVFQLPGVFLHNPYPGALNGSLWTIPLEVKCYFALLLLGVVRLLKVRWLFLAASVALAGYYYFVLHGRAASETDYLMRLGLFFAAGSCVYLFREWRESGHAYWILAVAALVFLSFKCYELAELALLPISIISVGLASTPVLRNFGRFGDLSYGTYIYAFAVQQALIWITGARLQFAAYLVISAALTVVLAFLSWHFVESPALKLKPGRRERAVAKVGYNV